MKSASLTRLAPTWHKLAAGAMVFAATAGSAFAQTLPDVPVPTDVQSGGAIHVIRWVIGIIILLSAAALVGFGMLRVGSAALKKFHDWNSGERGVELGDVIATVVMGLAILAVAILMGFGATQVIPSSIT
jgi:hypothetical protein